MACLALQGAPCNSLCAACSLRTAAAWSKVRSTLLDGAEPALSAVAGVLLLTPGVSPGLAALEVWEALGRPNHMSSRSEGLIASLGLACGTNEGGVSLLLHDAGYLCCSSLKANSHLPLGKPATGCPRAAVAGPSKIEIRRAYALRR
jgi:hypothetical protein